MTGELQPRAGHLQKADMAWQARVQGATWRQAAELAGYSTEQAAIRAVRRAYGQVPEIDREERRRLWRDRLEDLWAENRQDVRDRRAGAVVAGVRIVQAATFLDQLGGTNVGVSPAREELEAWVNAALKHSGHVVTVEEADIFE